MSVAEDKKTEFRRGAGQGGELSAEELAALVGKMGKDGRGRWVASILKEAVRSYEMGRTHHGLGSFEFSRVVHALGSAVVGASKMGRGGGVEIAAAIDERLTAKEKKRLDELGLQLASGTRITAWGERLKDAAFQHLSRTIVYGGGEVPAPPRNVLRSDEIVWGRAPARLDLGGGWTDTPPYSLERGGCVTNAAVDLNGQPPIQAYARVIEKREIRINSIDLGVRIEVESFKD